MSGFFGTDRQQELQRRTCLMRDRVAQTPGLYNAGRFTGIDDPARFPPAVLHRMLARDGLLGFRMISPPQAALIFPRLEARGCRIDRWDIFVGEPAGAGARAQALAGIPLPDGISVQPAPADPDGADTLRVQQFLAGNGLAPFPGTMLVAAPPEGITIVLAEGERIAAAGHAYFPHNAHSRFRGHAWIGLIAVDERWRGKGLGRLLNARLIRAAFDELHALHVYEMVAPSNAASRRMVESCGLRLDPALHSGVAVPSAAPRFTR